MALRYFRGEGLFLFSWGKGGGGGIQAKRKGLQSESVTFSSDFKKRADQIFHIPYTVERWCRAIG